MTVSWAMSLALLSVDDVSLTVNVEWRMFAFSLSLVGRTSQYGLRIFLLTLVRLGLGADAAEKTTPYVPAPAPFIASVS